MEHWECQMALGVSDSVFRVRFSFLLEMIMNIFQNLKEKESMHVCVNSDSEQWSAVQFSWDKSFLLFLRRQFVLFLFYVACVLSVSLLCL